MQSKLNQWVILSFAMLFMAGGAQANLMDGHTVSYTYHFPEIDSRYGTLSEGNYLVGPGTEVINGLGGIFNGTLDISDTNLLATFITRQFTGTPHSLLGTPLPRSTAFKLLTYSAQLTHLLL